MISPFPVILKTKKWDFNNMYCPLCFSGGISINQKGIIDLIINGKQLDNGRILFSTQMSKQEVLEELEKKITEFFKWYAKFQNVEPIYKVEVTSSSFSCPNKCKFKAEYRFSVINSLFTFEQLLNILNKLAPKYSFVVQIKDEKSPFPDSKV